MVERFFLGLAVTVGGLIGVVLVLAFALRVAGVLHTYRVPSSSMEPTLHCARPGVECLGGHSDRVIALDYVFSSPGRGDLVAFHTPPLAAERCGIGGTYIKRIVALPGERWEERSGFVYVDGKKLDEPYVDADRRDVRTIAPARVRDGEYILLGDNRPSSCDSRAWGPVPRKNIIGKIDATYWPPGRITVR